MESIAGWIAPAATMIAAMMTASNLGARVTGWGFVVFCVGSVAWLVVALSTGQQNLLLTNAVLLMVNVVGVWRWLGRQARYEDGGRAAATRSARASVPSLVSVSSLAGLAVKSFDGEELGQAVDAMLQCDGNDLAYVVVSSGGAGGLDETLRALRPEMIEIHRDGISVKVDRKTFERIPAIEPDRWPGAAPA